MSFSTWNRHNDCILQHFPVDSMEQHNSMEEADDWAEFEAAPVSGSTFSIGNDTLPDTDPWTEFDAAPTNSAPMLIDESGLYISSDTVVQQNSMGETTDWAEFEATPDVDSFVSVGNDTKPFEVETNPWTEFDAAPTNSTPLLIDENQSIVSSDQKVLFQENDEWAGFQACPKVAAVGIINSDLSIEVKSNTSKDIAASDTPDVAEECREDHELIESKQEELFIDLTPTQETVTISSETVHVPVTQIRAEAFAECDVVPMNPVSIESANADNDIIHNWEVSEKDVDIYSQFTPVAADGLKELDIWNGVTASNESQVIPKEVGVGDIAARTMNILVSYDNTDDMPVALETSHYVPLPEQNKTEHKVNKDNEASLLSSLVTATMETSTSDCDVFLSNTATKPNIFPLQTEETFTGMVEAQDASVDIEEDKESKDLNKLDFSHTKSDEVVTQSTVFVENDIQLEEALATSKEAYPVDTEVDAVGSSTTESADEVHFDSISTDDKKESISEIEVFQSEDMLINLSKEKLVTAVDKETIQEPQNEGNLEVGRNDIVSIPEKEVLEFNQNLNTRTNISESAENLPFPTFVNTVTNVVADFCGANGISANDEIPYVDYENKVNEVSAEANTIVEGDVDIVEAAPLSQSSANDKGSIEKVAATTSQNEEKMTEDSKEKNQPCNEEEEEDWDAFESAGVANHTEIVNIAFETETDTFRDEGEDNWAGFEGAAVPAEEGTTLKQPETNMVIPEVFNANIDKAEAEEDDSDWDGFESATNYTTMENTATVGAGKQQTAASSEQHLPSTSTSSATVHVPVICSSGPTKTQEDISQNEHSLVSLLQQLRSSRTNDTENNSILLSAVSHWQHFASMMQPNGDNVSRVCEEIAMPVLTVPKLLRSETPSGHMEVQPRHTQEDHLACVASSRAIVTHIFEQQQQRQQDMDILDSKALDAQLERLHLLPHQLHLACHVTPKPVVSSDSSRAYSSSFSFASPTSALVQPVVNKMLVRCGSGWQRKIARLSAVSMSMSHDTHDNPLNPTHGRETMLLNKQVSLTLQQSPSSSTNIPASYNQQNNSHNQNNKMIVASTVDSQEDAEDDWGGFIDSSPIPFAQEDMVDNTVNNHVLHTNDKEGSLSASAIAVLQQLPDLSFVLAT